MASITLEELRILKSIDPRELAELCLGRQRHGFNSGEQEWFCKYTELHTVWLYNNKPGWRAKLSRDFLYAFVNDWLISYIDKPQRFKIEHSLDTFIDDDEEDDED